MSEQNNTSWSAFAIGISTGVVAGFLLGLLFAPKPGKEAIGAIKDTVCDIDLRVKELTADRKKVYTKSWQQAAPKPYVDEFKSG